MKKILFSLFTIISFFSYAQETISDKNAQMRSVPSFSAIKVSGAIDVYLSQGSTDAVAVSASEDRFRDRIKTEVVDGVLKIWYDGDRLSLGEKKKLKAYVSFKDIRSLDASGASEFRIQGTLSVNSLNVVLSGASDVTGNVRISELTINASGASDVKLTGSVKNISIDVSGASDLKGYELTVDNCKAKASGASDIMLTVNSEISANATGASSVFYKGQAVVKEVHSHGSSSIAKKG